MEDTEAMVTVTGVKFKKNGKMYYFDPGELELQQGDGVIVETARGMEFARVTLGNAEIQESDVTRPLKKVVRVADEADLQRHEENESKKGHAMEVCREKIQKHNLDMKLIDVEFTFDNNKIIFYFTADGRVDFRDLVKDLASVFKMRIELRQVGVRDEAKMLGGIGCCGRELCCASWLADFQPVSIKMTKTQNLSLNPTKISGVCGRLMCCLKYENSTYQELRKGMPEVNERVRIGDEVGKVIETNILRGTVKVRMFTGEKDENGREKLNSEILTYDKEDVERLGKKASNAGKGAGAEHAAMRCPCQGKCRTEAAAGENENAGEETESGTDADSGAGPEIRAERKDAQSAAEETGSGSREGRRSAQEKRRDQAGHGGRNSRSRDRNRDNEHRHSRRSRSRSGKKKGAPQENKDHKKTEVVFQSFSFNKEEGNGKSSDGKAGKSRRPAGKGSAQRDKNGGRNARPGRAENRSSEDKTAAREMNHDAQD